MPTTVGYRAELSAWRCEYWRNLLTVHRGNIIHMAKAAGVHRETVYRSLREFGLIDRTRQAGRAGTCKYRPLQELKHVD